MGSHLVHAQGAQERSVQVIDAIELKVHRILNLRRLLAGRLRSGSRDFRSNVQ